MNEQIDLLHRVLQNSEAEYEQLTRDLHIQADGDQRLNELVEEIESLYKSIYDHYRDLRVLSPAYRDAVEHSSMTPPLHEVQTNMLDERTLLLMYLVGKEGGYVLLLTARDAELVALKVSDANASIVGVDAGGLTSDRVDAILLGQNGLLAQLARAEHRADVNAVLRVLADVLLPTGYQQSIVDQRYDRIVIIPSGALGYLPFEALVLNEFDPPTYLLDVAPPIHYVPSLAVWEQLLEREGLSSSPVVLTVGNPAYGQGGINRHDRAETRMLRHRAQLSGLPYSGLESRWLEESFGQIGVQTNRLTGQQATEANIRRHVTGKQIVHLACHGFADEDVGNLFGSLAVSMGADRNAGPMDDGYLTLAEIYDLDLRGCELAILSACQTNYGPREHGEGVWTLSRGFLVAGAQRVVASNWFVDDRATARLIGNYCAGLAEMMAGDRPVDYGSALVAAKRAIRNTDRWALPYYWASMSLIGLP